MHPQADRRRADVWAVWRMLHVRPTDQLARIRAAGEGWGGKASLSSSRFAIDRFLGPFHGICHPLSPNHVDIHIYIAAWVARLFKVVLKFTPPRGNARSPSSLRFLPALPPSLCMLLRLLMIALDRVRDLTRCE